jgi:hypothetical protein
MTTTIDDMKVTPRRRSPAHQIGKRLEPGDTDAESIGMLGFKGDGPAIFRSADRGR